MSTDRTFSNPLYRLYTQYVGEPQQKSDVYGFWVLLLGYVLAFLGILIFLFGPIAQQTTPGAWVAREIAYVMAASGLAFGLLGIVFMLPVRRIGIAGAVIGVAIAMVAVGLFTTLYPYDWALTPVGMIWTTIALYFAGIAIVAGVAALVPVVTGERSAMVETPEPEAEEGQSDVRLGLADREGLYTAFQTQTANWEWRLIDEEAIADGGDVFSSRIETVDAVERTRSHIESAGLLEINHPAFRLYEQDGAAWQWRLVDADGAVAARSDQEFSSREDAEGAVTAFMDHGPTADTISIEGAAFDYYREGDRWRWRLLAADRSELLRGPNRYDSLESVHDVTDRIANVVPAANVVDVESYGVELFDEGDTWRWRLLRDEEPIAMSEGTFASRVAVENAAHDVLEGLERAAIRDTSKPGFEVTQTRTGTWEWRLQTTSSTAVARNFDDASTQEAATQSAIEFQDGVMSADVFLVDGTAFETYPREDGWAWRLVDENRTAIAEGQDTYADEEDAEAAIDEIRAHAPDADLIEFEKAAFQIYEAGDGDWRWRLIDEDGDVLADSGEDYFSRDEAANAMNTVKEYAPDADLIQIETAAFELYQNDAGEWFWRLIDDTGELLARAGAGQPSRQGAKQSMDQLIDSASGAETRTMSSSGFQIYPRESTDWAWRYVTVDNRIIAEGTQTYPTRDQTTEEVESIRQSVDEADVVVIENVIVDLVERDDEWLWRIFDVERDRLASSVRTYPDKEAATEVVEAIIEHAAETIVFDIDVAAFKLSRENGRVAVSLIDEEHEVLGDGPQLFDDEDDARRSIDRIRSSAPDAGSIEFQEAAFEVYQGSAGWRWRLIDERHKVLAAAADPYTSREAAEADLENVKRLVRDASILDIDTSAFELHENDGEWRWQLIDENGSTLGRSLHSYSSRDAAREAMLSFKELGADARIEIAEYE